MIYKKFVLWCLVGISTGFLVSSVEAIVGGVVVNNHNEFSYQVSVQIQGRHICGGAIIGKRHIISAAHCFVNNNVQCRNNRVTILAGRNNLRATKHKEKAVIVDVEVVYVPKDYKPNKILHLHDIAVLKLKNPLDITLKNRNLKKLKMPKKTENYVGKMAKITGYGWDSMNLISEVEHGKRIYTQLRHADTAVLRKEDDSCTNIREFAKQICAQMKPYQGHDQEYGVCSGDSGGPLVHKDTIIGVLTGSPQGCNEKKGAATYTRVSHYLSLIRDVKKNNKSALEAHTKICYLNK